MRVYVISILFNKLFVFGCIFYETLIHYFIVFGCITTQALIKYALLRLCITFSVWMHIL